MLCPPQPHARLCILILHYPCLPRAALEPISHSSHLSICLLNLYTPWAFWPVNCRLGLTRTLFRATYSHRCLLLIRKSPAKAVVTSAADRSQRQRWRSQRPLLYRHHSRRPRGKLVESSTLQRSLSLRELPLLTHAERLKYQPKEGQSLQWLRLPRELLLLNHSRHLKGYPWRRH